MDLQRKLEILADAAKYDASCASSGTEKRTSADGKGLGSTSPGMGICHSYAPDGRCISLLKVLLTNACNYDCLYCVNRASSNVPRARFSNEEVVNLTLDFYRRNYIEGLFLSSGIIRNPDYTMEQVVAVARELRARHFRGYIHLKTIPEADELLIAEAGKYADRLSINIELPSESSLARLAPEKNVRSIRRAMGRLRLKIEEATDTTSRAKPPKFAPAGQSTQMIVGADDASDRTILTNSAGLYGSYQLKRVYYSAFSPIPDASRSLPLATPPLLREHRLYQADWLMRFYGFETTEIVEGDDMLSLELDPKLAWALRHPDRFPIDIISASREELLRVPGFGRKAVDRIIATRRQTSIRVADLARLHIPRRKALLFIVLSDHRPSATELQTIVSTPQRAQQLALALRPHMISVELESETDFDGWRRHARGLALNDVPTSNVVWSVGGAQAELLGDAFDLEPSTPQRHFSVPKEFIELAEVAILHRNTERFALLYRLLLRLRTEHALLENAVDADVAELRAMAKAVRRDEHKMHAFVRFREVTTGQGPHFVAWFEPAHHVVEFAAPFFAERFADMNWAILTPDRCAHWDRQALSFTAGVSKLDAPSEDRLEDVWRSYYASIFNPARLKIKAMQGHMPKKYWRNLPEASLIKPLIGAAERATAAMIGATPPKPVRHMQRREMTMSRPSHDSLSGIRNEAEHCRACPLWENATQVVFGEGPKDASVMLVGEQPGDKEDLAGKPFVGPAGQVLDRALHEAGVDRSKTYVTNAVKHFKFVLRGKVRLHQKPGTTEIRACRQWYQRELDAVRPQLVVALGATAAQAVFGKATPVNKNRGRVIELADGTQVLVTVHPSYLLRLPDEDAQREEYARFVEDLKIAARYLKEHARAA